MVNITIHWSVPAPDETDDEMQAAYTRGAGAQWVLERVSAVLKHGVMTGVPYTIRDYNGADIGTVELTE